MNDSRKTTYGICKFSCPQGLASIEYLHQPQRVRHPMKRFGKRGEGKWQTISHGFGYGVIAFTRRAASHQARGLLSGLPCRIFSSA